MMHLPVPTAYEVRLSFYVAAVAVLAIIATVCWGIVHKINQSDVIVSIAAANADQVERLNTQLDAQTKAAEGQREELKRQNRLTREQLRALLRYLRAHGIEVPQTALTPPPRDEGSVTRPKAAGPSQGPKPTPSPSPPHPASPAPTAGPTPTPSPGPIGPLCDLLALPRCPLN